MSGGPRNRVAWERGQRVREAIQSALQQHDPLALPLTADDIRQRLEAGGIYVARSTVYFHLAAIRGSRRRPDKRYNNSNSFTQSGAASCMTGAGDGTHPKILRP